MKAIDEVGERYYFRGRAVAMNPIPVWPNSAFHDSLVRWENEDGRVAHSTFQEAWSDDVHRALCTWLTGPVHRPEASAV